MKHPSEKELELLNHLWKIKKGFLKDIVEQYLDPKPAYTTISTMLNRMVAKEYIGFVLHGREKEYSPLLNKSDYFTGRVKKMVTNYFNDSPTQFASFFTKGSDLSIEELESLRKLVDEEIEQKRKES